VPLKLHTVDEARDRYRAWAASEWERINVGPATKWLAKTAPCTSSEASLATGAWVPLLCSRSS